MLEPILESTRARLPAIAARVERAGDDVPAAPPGFASALAAGSGTVIAEIKRRSPSAGPINLDLDPVSVATAYADGGAAAVSVLTEPDHFAGSLDDLSAVAAATGLPVLCKDFILDPIQIRDARLGGAAAVLLIVSILDDDSLRSLLGVARAEGLDALVETHDRSEVERAVAAGAQVIGVNNRDLATFSVDLTTAIELRSAIPDGVVAVAESGVKGPDDARRMFDSGFDAVLVGQAATQAPDPAAFVHSLVAE